MNLRDRFHEDIKEAMLSGDDRVRDTLRMVEGMVSNKEIDLRSQGKSLDNEVVESILVSAVKQRRESVLQYRAGSRDDLVAKEEAEIAILERYLPDPISEEQIRRIVVSVGEHMGAVGMKDMGRMMGLVMVEAKKGGSVDGSLVRRIVQEYLQSL